MIAPRSREQLDRMREEEVGGRAFPLRVGRREMLADVAEAGGAEQGVGDRMEHDVGIAVAGKAALVRDRDAAEHDRARRRRRRGRRSPCRCAAIRRAGEPLLGARRNRRRR